MHSPVEQIKERLSIEEVVSSYIKVEKAGSNLKARCPFHNEKTPSFFISTERKSYYCFGCGAKGDIFTFVEEFEGLDFKGALKLLAERAGVVLTEWHKDKDGLKASEKDRLYMAMEEATKYFENNLKINTDAQSYLTSRGLNEKTIKDFRIGFARLEWRELHTHLRSKNFTDVEIEKAGLGKKTEKGMYDRFRGRIMFPISDTSGRVIAFSGRLFIDDGKSAKYLNSPETPIFTKSAVLYGLDKAKDSIRRNNFSILVEGQMDLLLSHQAGWKNTIATSGTALTDATLSKENVVSNLGLVRRISNNIVLGFDGDSAGIKATERAGKIALSLGMDVKVLELPENVDPADLISKSGPESWKEVIKNSKHLIEFILNKVIKANNKDVRKIGKEVKEKVLPFVDILNSAIDKEFFLKKISDVTSISLTALEDDLKKVSEEVKFEKKEMEIAEEAKRDVFKRDFVLKRLLGIVFWQSTKENPLFDTNKVLTQTYLILGEESENILAKYTTSKDDLIFEAEVFYEGGADLKKDVAELLKNLEEEYLKEELAKNMRELYFAEENKDKTKSEQILKEIQIINNKIQDLKNSQIISI